MQEWRCAVRLVPAKRRTRLINLRPGAIFATEYGLAVKSEYFTGSSVSDQPQCILLASGEYGCFPNGGQELVREMVLVEDEDHAP